MERHNLRPVCVRSQGFRVQHIRDANLAVFAAHRRAEFNQTSVGKQDAVYRAFLPHVSFPCPCRDPALEPLNWKLKRRWCRAREREHAVPPPSQPFSLPPGLITRNNNEKEARSKTTNNSRECKGIGGNRGGDEAERLPQRRACKFLRHVDRYPCTLPPMCRSSSCRTHLHGRRRGWRPPQAPRRSPPCGTPYLSRPQSKERGSQAVHDPSQRTHKVLVWSKRGKKTPSSSPLSPSGWGRRGTALAVICLTNPSCRFPYLKKVLSTRLRVTKIHAVALTFSAKHAAMHCGRHARDYRGLRGVHRERLL